MEDFIKVTLLENRDSQDKREIKFKSGTTLLEIARQVQPHPARPIMGALVNNSICDLREYPKKDCTVRFLDITHPDGYKIYVRGLSMVLAKANFELFPQHKLKILHSLSKGLYCRWSGGEPMKSGDLKKLEEKMREIILEDVPFIRRILTRDEASQIFENMGKEDKVRLIRFRKKEGMSVYFCGEYPDYFFGRLPPSTGVLEQFQLKLYPPGLILRFPNSYSPDRIPPYELQQQHARVYFEHKKWVEILGVSDVASLNTIIMEDKIKDFILVAEALQEKKIADIADKINRDIDRIRLILIAGPSSSGKTTFANRLAVQLKVNGLRPVAISLDDYFVDNDKTPLDEEGNPDFDHVDAVDIPLFNEHLHKILCGEKVSVPLFNFKKGRRDGVSKELELKNKEILIVEGIHGLNPILTEAIHPDNKYKIYVSALAQLNMDNHNRLPTTDNRIIRRIVRDSRYRNHNALTTIRQWPMVRRGEERFIFPFQEEADVMFNSALLYELSVLKNFVEPLLREIPADIPEYAEAKRLLSFISNFLPVDAEQVPINSILREFIGPHVCSK